MYDKQIFTRLQKIFFYPKRIDIKIVKLYKKLVNVTKVSLKFPSVLRNMRSL